MYSICDTIKPNSVTKNKDIFLFLINAKLNHTNKIGKICGLKEKAKNAKKRTFKIFEIIIFELSVFINEYFNTITRKYMNNDSLKIFGMNHITDGSKKAKKKNKLKFLFL